MTTSKIIDGLFDQLFEIVQDLIKSNLLNKDLRHEQFFQNPDDPAQHSPIYHQWGVITHTKKFDEYNRDKTPLLLEKWGLKEQADKAMAEKIDGLTKADLLSLAIPLHDLGKFSKRTIAPLPDGSAYFHFKGHEAESGRIIRAPAFRDMLVKKYRLTPRQIEYIAQCAEKHYKLADVRDQVKSSKMGYSFAFAHSPEFKKAAQGILTQHKAMGLEIGLLYLGDSMAKTDIHLEAKNDQAVEAQAAGAAEEIKQRGLDPRLIKGVKQLPVTFAVVENYLKGWAGLGE